MVEPVITNLEIPDHDGEIISPGRLELGNIFPLQRRSWSLWTVPRPATSSSAASGWP